jgi:TolB protein
VKNTQKAHVTVLAIMVALAATGCASTSKPGAPSGTPTTMTVAPLGPPALGDGGRIAVALKTGDSSVIISLNSDGTDARRLTDGEAADACPDFGPGGALIAYCSDRAGGRIFEIWLMDGAGGHQRQLTTLGGDSFFPDVSPDGKRVVFCGSKASTQEHDIWLVNVDGTGLVQLTNTPGEDDCYPTWSPDGSKVLFTSTRGGSQELWVMDANGQSARQLTKGAIDRGSPPDWSPDGRRVAYVDQGFVWVMSADGGTPTRLTQAPGSDYAPAWSPKGNEIVYRHLDAGNVGTLRIVSVQSGQIRAVPIEINGTPVAPAWQLVTA